MRFARLVVASLLFHAVGSASPPSQHLRWQRGITVPGTRGPVCAVLDAQVMAHAGSRAKNDLRVFREAPGGEVEVPFSLMESEAEPDDLAVASVRNATVRGDAIELDLEMPRRAYSNVVLKIEARDFVGSAVVMAAGKVLGSFAVFDLSGEGLARSTTLALGETTLPEIHVSLRMMGLRGRRLGLSAAMVQGAEVPVSREAQTLYTVVASTRGVQRSRYGTAQMQMEVPAYVPVERVSFMLDPEFHGEFLRGVTVGGVLPVGGDPVAREETVAGSIWSVQRPGMVGSPAIDARHLDVDAVLGLTLRDSAKVVVEVNDVVHGRALPPLPIREVRLEMRQRSVCFAADAGARYMLRYGDAGLAAPVYTQMAAIQKTAVATLGAESVNADFHPEARGSQGRVGVAWIAGVCGLVVIWASAGILIRRKGGLHR